MSLLKRSVQVEENGNKAQTVFEHNIVKIGTPVLGILLLSIVTWLFQTVLEIDEQMQKHSIMLEHLREAEEHFGEQMEKVQTTLTDLRIQVGRNIGSH